jgi:hypothetical protein
LEKVAKEGVYTGIETPLKFVFDYGEKEYFKLLNQFGLKLLPMVFTSDFLALGSDRQKYPNHPAPVLSVSFLFFLVFCCHLRFCSSLFL